MSTWQDLIDDNSVNRFVDGCSSWSSVQDRSENQESSFVDVTEPPNTTLYETDLISSNSIAQADDDLLSNGSDGEITILSSVPSSVVEHFVVDSTAFSEPTTVTDSNNDVDGALSLNASSIASSVMTEWMEEQSDTTTNTPPSSNDESQVVKQDTQAEVSDGEDSDEDELESLPRPVDTAPACETMSQKSSVHTSSSSSSTETGDVDETQKLWYSQFQNETDWNELHASVQEILQAMDSKEDEDAIIAQLIAAEEAYLWDKKHNNINTKAVAVVAPKSWMTEIVAGAATIAVASFAAFKIIKGLR